MPNGPDYLHITLWKLAGEAEIVRLETSMTEALNRSMPTTWQVGVEMPRRQHRLRWMDIDYVHPLCHSAK